MLSPCSSVLGLKLQYLSLSAVPSSPMPTPQPLPASPEPTAAARQLDELLADLGQMQSKLAAVGQGAGAPVGSAHSLDHMLGGLTRDLQELGITAAPAAVCAACHKPIAGKMFTALGETWHPEHFTCARCGQELGGQPFFERGGQAYCEEDYHQAFSPRCAYCAGPIREVSTALPTSAPWYPAPHLSCAHRESSPPWTRPGTPSTSSAPTAGRCLEMMVSMSAVGNPTASRTLWSSSPPSARAVSGH